MGVRGVGHRLDTAEVDGQSNCPGSLLYLILAHGHCVGIAQALAVEIGERFTFYRYLGQQLHAMPHRGDLHIRVTTAKLHLRMLQLAFADQAPGADKIEKHINT
ncbi:hypothetical protein D3C78_1115940 [compost metagenome]